MEAENEIIYCFSCGTSKPRKSFSFGSKTTTNKIICNSCSQKRDRGTKKQARLREASEKYPRVDEVTSPAVPTDQAAYYLNRQPQTLRAWASQENGPIRPVRVNGRLAWRIADIKRVMGMMP